MYYDVDTQSANFRSNPLRQATKRYVNNSYTVKNDEKLDDLSSVWLSCCFSKTNHHFCQGTDSTFTPLECEKSNFILNNQGETKRKYVKY